MADSSGGSDGNKRWTKGKIGGLCGGGGILTVVAVLWKQGITISQIIQWINNWPIVLLGLGICLAYIIVECVKQVSETTRTKNSLQNYKDEVDKLKRRSEELEKELNDKKEEAYRLALEKGQLEAKIQYLEKKIERLKNSKGGKKRL